MKDLALCLTDSHLEESTVDINRSIWKQAVDVCKERGIKRIYHLGDALDSRKSQTQDMLIELSSLFEMVTEEGIEIFAIPGNHDKTDYLSYDSFLDVYKHHPNVNIIREGQIVYVDGDCTVSMMPYFDEKKCTLYQEGIENINIADRAVDVNILLTHIGVDGATMNGGMTIEDHISKNLFEKFSHIYIGHYHNKQEMYVGSCYASNFGEDNDKGFNILRSDGTLEFIPTVFPKFTKVVVDLTETSKEDLLVLKKEYGDSEDNIRVVFKGDEKDIAGIDKNSFLTLGIDVKTDEDEIDHIQETGEVVNFDANAIKEEWEDFTKEDQESMDEGFRRGIGE